MKKWKEMFRSSQSRYGTYSTLLVVIVVAIVIVANMIAGRLPEKWKNIDLSENHLYEITDQSRNLLKSLDKKVSLHILADKSSADERIKTFVDKYAGLSSKISVEWIDPVLHPSALKEYDASENTIVVECPDTEKTTQIAFTDIITYDETSYYYYGTYQENEFDGEGQLTSAVNYVVNETESKIYTTTGHGETALASSLEDLLDKSGFTTEEINTLMAESIPEDCDLLIIHAPTKDLGDDEKKMITEWMQDDHDVILVLGDTDNETPNLDALMKEYGMQVADGYIADTKRCYQGQPFYIFPELTVSDKLATGIESEMIMVINARGMTETDPARDTISLSTFMSTSDGGYAVTEDKQTEGTYLLGAIATENDSHFTVITAATMIDENLTGSLTTLENNTLFMNLVTNNFDDISNVAIEPKSLQVEYNTVKHAGSYSLATVFGIPIVILVYGFVTWLKRRKA